MFLQNALRKNNQELDSIQIFVILGIFVISSACSGPRSERQTELPLISRLSHKHHELEHFQENKPVSDWSVCIYTVLVNRRHFTNE